MADLPLSDRDLADELSPVATCVADLAAELHVLVALRPPACKAGPFLEEVHGLLTQAVVILGHAQDLLGADEVGLDGGGGTDG